MGSVNATVRFLPFCSPSFAADEGGGSFENRPEVGEEVEVDEGGGSFEKRDEDVEEEEDVEDEPEVLVDTELLSNECKQKKSIGEIGCIQGSLNGRTLR